MSTPRAVALVATVSILSALVLAWVSRTPSQVRERDVPAEAYSAELGSRFPAEDVARHGAYRAPAYVHLALSTLLSVVVLVVLAAGPWRQLVARIEALPGGWVVHVLIAAVCITLLMWLAGLPLGFVRGYVIDKAWALSTQDPGGWFSDQLRGTAVGAVAAALAAIAFFGVVRWQPRSWWVVAWAAFTALTIALTFVWPIWIAPLFNRFTPLADQDLEGRARALAEAAGIQIEEVLVADASRRTTAENAYVAGLGATKQLVLYDTLVKNDDADATAHVIAHELGHRAEGHIGKNIAIGAVGLLLGFIALRALAGAAGIWERAGASGVGDLRALPVLMLFALVAGLVVLPIQSTISRRFEREADAVAMRLTEDPSAAVRTFRRLAYSNLADLRPHPVAVALLFSHPPIPERIESALAQGAKSP
jgi:STE24 endopeptidase